MAKQAEFRHIGNPLLVWFFCMEIPVQKVRRNLACFSFVGSIFLHPHATNQAHLFHQSLDCFVIQRNIPVTQLYGDAAIAIPTFVFMVYGCDFRFGSLILICTIHPLQMIVERCPGQLSDRYKYFQRMFLPQFLNYLRFLRWRRSSSKTKACKFFR